MLEARNLSQLTLSLDAVAVETAGEAGVFLVIVVFVDFLSIVVGDDVLEFVLFVAADLSFKLLLLLIMPPFSWWRWSAFDVAAFADTDVSGLLITDLLLLVAAADGGGVVASVWFNMRLWSANKR